MLQTFQYMRNIRYVGVYQPKKKIIKISSPISFTNHLINSNFVLYLNKLRGIFYGNSTAIQSRI